jgi:hypothetical protein
LAADQLGLHPHEGDEENGDAALSYYPGLGESFQGGSASIDDFLDHIPSSEEIEPHQFSGLQGQLAQQQHFNQYWGHEGSADAEYDDDDQANELDLDHQQASHYAPEDGQHSKDDGHNDRRSWHVGLNAEQADPGLGSIAAYFEPSLIDRSVVGDMTFGFVGAHAHGLGTVFEGPSLLLDLSHGADPATLLGLLAGQDRSMMGALVLEADDTKALRANTHHGAEPEIHELTQSDEADAWLAAGIVTQQRDDNSQMRGESPPSHTDSLDSAPRSSLATQSMLSAFGEGSDTVSHAMLAETTQFESQEQSAAARQLSVDSILSRRSSSSSTAPLGAGAPAAPIHSAHTPLSAPFSSYNHDARRHQSDASVLSPTMATIASSLDGRSAASTPGPDGIFDPPPAVEPVPSPSPFARYGSDGLGPDALRVMDVKRTLTSTAHSGQTLVRSAQHLHERDPSSTGSTPLTASALAHIVRPETPLAIPNINIVGTPSEQATPSASGPVHSFLNPTSLRESQSDEKQSAMFANSLPRRLLPIISDSTSLLPDNARNAEQSFTSPRTQSHPLVTTQQQQQQQQQQQPSIAATRAPVGGVLAAHSSHSTLPADDADRQRQFEQEEIEFARLLNEGADGDSDKYQVDCHDNAESIHGREDVPPTATYSIAARNVAIEQLLAEAMDNSYLGLPQARGSNSVSPIDDLADRATFVPEGVVRLRSQGSLYTISSSSLSATPLGGGDSLPGSATDLATQRVRFSDDIDHYLFDQSRDSQSASRAAKQDSVDPETQPLQPWQQRTVSSILLSSTSAPASHFPVEQHSTARLAVTLAHDETARDETPFITQEENEQAGGQSDEQHSPPHALSSVAPHTETNAAGNQGLAFQSPNATLDTSVLPDGLQLPVGSALRSRFPPSTPTSRPPPPGPADSPFQPLVNRVLPSPPPSVLGQARGQQDLNAESASRNRGVIGGVRDNISEGRALVTDSSACQSDAATRYEQHSTPLLSSSALGLSR